MLWVSIFSDRLMTKACNSTNPEDLLNVSKDFKNKIKKKYGESMTYE